MWHAFIILTKVILGIFWAILETDTWEPLVELTRNDPAVYYCMSKACRQIGVAKAIMTRTFEEDGTD